MKLSSCLCCGNTELIPYLNLGYQPPPNAFHLPGEEPPPAFPLEICVCNYCWHSQVMYAVDPSILFSNYTYRTGVSSTLDAHYAKLSEDVINSLESSTTCGIKLSVLDIGCNDGTLLKHFKLRGLRTIGVDPCIIESEYIDIKVKGYWEKGLSLVDKNIPIITATNVLAHNTNPKDFIKACYVYLADYGVAVFEFPYAKSLLLNCEFDTMYHEHYSYFLVMSIIKLFNNTGLYIKNVQLPSVHGGSIRLYCMKCEVGKEYENHCTELLQLESEEKQEGLNTYGCYVSFGMKVHEKKQRLLDTMKMLSRYEICIFGASAKSTVMLNYLGEKNIKIAFDETPSKIGKIIPGTNTKILPLDVISTRNFPYAFFIMSWNCLEESINKINKYLDKEKPNVYFTHIPNILVSQLTGS